jgi:hypothetical protein
MVSSQTADALDHVNGGAREQACGLAAIVRSGRQYTTHRRDLMRTVVSRRRSLKIRRRVVGRSAR